MLKEAFFRGVFKNRLPILLLVLIGAAVGFKLLEGIPQGVFPNVFFPRIQVTIENGHAPIQQELFQVTRPAELSLKTVQGVQKIVSNTSTGLTEIELYFDWSTDPHLAYQYVQTRLAELKNALPREALTTVIQATPSRYPVAIYALTSDSLSRQRLTDEIYYNLRPYLLSTPGLFDVQIVAPAWQEYQVVLDADKLRQYNLQAETVADYLKSQNQIQFLGLVQQYQYQYVLTLSQKPARLQELLDIEVPLASGQRVALKDIALTLSDTPPPTEYTAVSDARQSVTLTLLRQPEADSVAVKDAVNSRIQELNQRLKGQGMELREYYDETAFIRASVEGVRDAVLLGTLITTVIVFLFLRKLKLALFLLLIVPAIFMMTAMGLQLGHIDLNIFSLGGMAAAVGGLIDHLIIVIESIEKAYHRGVDKLTAVIRGSLEILPLMTSATLISILLFLPLLLVSGVVGVFFKQLAFVIIATYIISQALAICFTPVVAYFALPNARPRQLSPAAHSLAAPSGTEAPEGSADPAEVPAERPDWFERLIRPVLAGVDVVLHRPWAWLCLPVIAVLLGVTYYLYTHLTSTFLPNWDEGSFVVDVDLPPGTSLDRSIAQNAEIAKILDRQPAIERWSMRIGSSLGSVSKPANVSEFVVVLKPDRSQSSVEVQDAIKSEVEGLFTNLEAFDTPQVLEDRLADILGEDSPITVQLYGPNPDSLIQWGGKLRDALRKEDVLDEVNLQTSYTSPSLDIHVKAVAMSVYGLDVPTISNHLNTLFYGQSTGDLIEGEKVIGIRTRSNLSQNLSVDELLSMLIFSPKLNRMIPLSLVVDLKLIDKVPEVTHQNLSPVALVTVRFKGNDMSGAVAVVKRVVQDTHLPQDITPQISGFYEQQQQSFQEMLLVVSLAIVIIFVSLLFQFSELRIAGVILVGLLLSLGGALLGLFITGKPLDITGFMGILIVLSIVINNNILIFDFYQHYRQSGTGARQALLHALQERSRPIVMTMLSNICALLPIALAWGAGTQLIQNMAIAIMGGLALALPVSLLLIPQLFMLLQPRDSV